MNRSYAVPVIWYANTVYDLWKVRDEIYKLLAMELLSRGCQITYNKRQKDKNKLNTIIGS